MLCFQKPGSKKYDIATDKISYLHVGRYFQTPITKEQRYLSIHHGKVWNFAGNVVLTDEVKANIWHIDQAWPCAHLTITFSWLVLMYLISACKPGTYLND